MDEIREAINEVFAPDPSLRLSPETRLEEIPDWDSMNAVNLIMHLQGRLGTPLKGVAVNGRMTLRELETALRAAGALR